MENKKSRSNYFKERRKNTKTFYAEIDTDKMDKLEKKLKEQKETKISWLIKKIDQDTK
ncbi:MAG: hypothetical protein ACK5HP_01300 [Bacilli bacterium]